MPGSPANLICRLLRIIDVNDARKLSSSPALALFSLDEKDVGDAGA